MIAMSRDAGVNFLDTADAYMDGESERVVGRLIRGERDAWVVASKTGSIRGPGPFTGRLTRKWMFQAIDATLDRLATDYVDIYYMHHRDPETPLVESIGAMGDIIAEGKALYWGFSNYYGWEVGEIIRLCDDTGTPRPIVCQPLYNAFNRMPETDLLPACDHYGIGVAPYSPIARGVLSGKYLPGAEPPPDSRVARGEEMILKTEYRPKSLELARTIKDYAEGRGMSAVQFAYMWVLHNKNITAAIAGPRTVDHYTDYLGILEKTFTVEDEAFLDSLVPSGFPSTYGYCDPRYPFQGRRPRGDGN